MKATVDAKALDRAVKTVAPFVSNVTSHPALSSIKITAADDSLELVAGDLDTWAATSVPAEVIDGGEVLVPRAVLLGAAGALGGMIEMRTNGGDLDLVGDDRHISARCGDAALYPQIEWPADAFVDLGDAWGRIKRILFAASRDAARPKFNAVGFEAGGTACCCSSPRVAYCAIPGGLEVRASLASVERAAKVLGDEVSMLATPNVVVFADDVTTILSRTVDAEAPDWRRAIPEDFTHTLEVDVAELADAIGVVSALPDGTIPEGREMRVRQTDEGRLELTAILPDIGAARAVIDCTGTWPPVVVGLNPLMLHQAIAAPGCERVQIKTIDERKPLRVVGGDIEQILVPRYLT